MTVIVASIKKHFLAIILALVVGLISVAPQLVFIFSLGSKYLGLPMLAMANEDAYLSRMSEVIDGHIFIGSAWFYEYKDVPPLLSPVAEWLWVGVSKLLFLSLINLVLLMKFLLPVILFVLVYFLILKIIDVNNWFGKLTAIAGATFVTLGYDLVDYRTVWGVIGGTAHLDAFSIWTRPVNPINGAIIVFSLLLTIWSFTNSITKTKIILAVTLFALGIYTYFFTWALSLSIIGVLLVIYFFQKRWQLFKVLLLTLLLGFLLAVPYFYLVSLAANNPWYADASARIGLTYNHQPIVNKVLIASLLFFLLSSLFLFKNKPDSGRLRRLGYRGGFLCKVLRLAPTNYSHNGLHPCGKTAGYSATHNKEQLKNQSSDWWWFCLALLLGGLWSFNQQVVTGVSVWPYHFVQYTIPLALVVLLVVINKVIGLWSKIVWGTAITLIIFVSFSYGVYNQVASYAANADHYRNLQSLMPVLDWFNENTQKDSVILVLDDRVMVSRLVTIFTHNNVYLSDNIVSLIPIERLADNYMVDLRVKDIAPDDLDFYIQNSITRYKSYFGALVDFKELATTETYLRNRDIVINSYPEFYRGDFYSALKKYRLDYVLSSRNLENNLAQEFPTLALLEEINGFYIYRLP